MLFTRWATTKITISTQNDNFNHFEWNRCHFVPLLSFSEHLFSSQLKISHVLNGTTPEIQHGKWGPLKNPHKTISTMEKRGRLLWSFCIYFDNWCEQILKMWKENEIWQLKLEKVADNFLSCGWKQNWYFIFQKFPT